MSPVGPRDPRRRDSRTVSRSGSRRRSRAELTIAAWWRDLRTRRDSAVRGRFSVEKTRRFITYSKTASRRRQLAVVSLYPLPALLVAIALACIPLCPPRRGVLANWPFFVHLWCVVFVSMTTAILQARAVSRIRHDEYSTRVIVTTAAIATTLVTGFTLSLAVGWRFPVPFSLALDSMPFVASIVLAHVVMVRCGLQLSTSVRTKLLLQIPALLLQVSQLVIYPAYSALFAAANEWQQIVLVFLFPCIKWGLRRSLLAVSRHLGDFTREFATCGVEIAAAMYQTAIMQGTPSLLVSAAVIGVDIVINLYEIKHYLDRHSVLPTDQSVFRLF